MPSSAADAYNCEHTLRKFTLFKNGAMHVIGTVCQGCGKREIYANHDPINPSLLNRAEIWKVRLPYSKPIAGTKSLSEIIQGVNAMMGAK